MKILLFPLYIILALGPTSIAAFTPSSQNTHSSPSINSHHHHQHGRKRNLIITSAATIDGSPSSYEMSDFARRMKNIIRKDAQQQQQQRRSNRGSTTSPKAPKNLMRITTLSEFKQVVGDEEDKLVVVRWYAPWCKACKAIAPSFYRLAYQYPNVIFVDVPVTPENANLHQGLAVPSLPYGHIYHPTGKLVEELKISKKHFVNFATILKSYVDEECSIEFDDESGSLMEPKYGLPDEDDSRRRKMAS